MCLAGAEVTSLSPTQHVLGSNPFTCNDKYFYLTQQRQGNIFTIVSQSFCSRGGGCLLGHAGIHALSIPWQVHAPGRYTPLWKVHPLAGAPPYTPPHDGHCSGRYASYWNAFLLSLNSANSVKETFRKNSSEGNSLTTENVLVKAHSQTAKVEAKVKIFFDACRIIFDLYLLALCFFCFPFRFCTMCMGPYSWVLVVAEHKWSCWPEVSVIFHVNAIKISHLFYF